MRVHSLISQCFLLLVFLSLCDADDDSKFQVVGIAECGDCNKNNLNTNEAFAGLGVTIDCKLKNGDMKRIGAVEINEGGQFKISLPQEIVHENGQKLKQDCYAQLHNAAALPCPNRNGREASKIVFVSQHTFAPSKNLQFSVTLCTSKFFWPFFNPNHPWFKYFGHPWLSPPQVPVYPPPPPPPEVEPLPQPTPPVEPPPPPEEAEPLPPPTPPKRPCPPKPQPPPVHHHPPPKKPCPPNGPKPKPPPVYHHPPTKKPCPPKLKPPHPPKKPCPPPLTDPHL